jgi:hypothetical protein
MPFLFLVILISLSFLPSMHQEEPEIPSAKPELIEGPWETESASGIDGIFLTIVTGSDWQTIDIRVCHRDAEKGTWGYFGTNEKAAAGSYGQQENRSFTLFDGSHLRIHFVDVTDLKPFDLDVIFSSGSHQTSGTWSRPDQPTSHVVLKRPEPKPGITPNPFTGDWATVSRSAEVASGTIHIRQSSDGNLSAWLDRAIAPGDRRNGEFLQVLSAVTPELDLERPGDIGPSYRYHGNLSVDGQRLTGAWAENSGARLNAPDTFSKVPD